jgi:HPt (histidine-containing phosphotransfer) domain-containing protein
LAELFLDETPRLLDQLVAATASRDAAAATRLAHGLKGSATTVGAARVRDAAQHLERAGAIADWDAFEGGLDRLRSEVDCLVAVLSEVVPVAI